MKIQIWKTLIMLSVLAVLTTISARAQSGTYFTVTIPFKFNVAGKTLPAGQYRIGRSTQTSNDGLVLHETSGRSGAFVLTRGIQTEEIQQQSKLIFHRYGSEYFLAEVWTSATGKGRELPTSRREREIRQEIAQGGGSPAKVAIYGDKH